MLQEPYPALTWHIRSDDRREFGACFLGRDISGKKSSEERGEKRRREGGTLSSIYGTDIFGGPPKC